MQKTILVTGANRGIGFEIVRQLAGQGHRLILTARSKEKGQAAIDRLNEENLQVDFMPLDVANSESIVQMQASFGSKYPHLDVLINNAGILPGKVDSVQVSSAEMRQVFDTNVFGLLEVSQKMILYLRESNAPRIINFSSEMGQIKGLEHGHYASYRLSKFAVNGITMLMAADLQNSGIKVNAMHPGWVKTEMGGATAPRSVSDGAACAVWLATAENIPNGKLLRDNEIIPW